MPVVGGLDVTERMSPGVCAVNKDGDDVFKVGPHHNAALFGFKLGERFNHEVSDIRLAVVCRLMMRTV